MKSVIEKLPLVMFVVSLCFFSSLLGMAIWERQLFPYEIIKGAVEEFYALLPEKALNETGEKTEQIEDEKRPSHLFPIRYRSYGTTVHNADAVSPGVTLMTTYWPEHDWSTGIRLIDIKGNKLHHWHVNPRSIWPLRNFPRNTYVHGSYLFPNGDVLFNIEYAGLVRMNSCGKVVWKTDVQTHHSVFRSEDGNFWVSGYHTVKAGNPRARLFPAIKPPFAEETLIKFSPEGEMLAEISLLEALYYSDYKHLLWHYERIAPKAKNDIIHLNDVEVLGSALADGFPTLDAGDIVVSSNFMSFVAVLNPKGSIKWLKAGEFTNQHDPDFEPGGWISIYDNRRDRSLNGVDLGGTRIRAINPMTNEIRDVYPANKTQKRFYSPAGGKHQLLGNGNRLITESQAGRVFEVSSQGETVWEWISQPYDNKFVPEILEGSRYSNVTIKDIRQWPCSELP